MQNIKSCWTVSIKKKIRSTQLSELFSKPANLMQFSTQVMLVGSAVSQLGLGLILFISVQLLHVNFK